MLLDSLKPLSMLSFMLVVVFNSADASMGEIPKALHIKVQFRQDILIFRLVEEVLAWHIVSQRIRRGGVVCISFERRQFLLA
jgi:hypothetical protein